MSLSELSYGYEEAAQLLRDRLKELRAEARATEDLRKKWCLRLRISELTPILTQMNELAELTARYYERGYWRNDKYTL